MGESESVLNAIEKRSR